MEQNNTNDNKESSIPMNTGECNDERNDTACNDCTDCVCCKSGPQKYAEMIDSFMAENGFAIIGVFDAEPPFAYTIGLTAKGFPELIIVANFNPQEFNGIMNSVGHKFIEAATATKAAVDGTTPIDYETLPVMIEIRKNNAPVSVPVGLKKIRKEFHEMLLGQALARYGEVECIQVVIPDANGKLPWDDGFDTHWSYHAMQIPLYQPMIVGDGNGENVDDHDNNSDSENNHPLPNQ